MAIPWTVARATGRRQVSWLAGQGLMHAFPDLSGPVATRDGSGPVHRAHRLQLQGQPRLGEASLPHRIPISAPHRGTGAILNDGLAPSFGRGL